MSITELIEVKTADLTSAPMLWAVCIADGREIAIVDGRIDQEEGLEYAVKLIHKHAVSLEPSDPWAEYGNQWSAMCITTRDDAANSYHHQFGPDPITAGLRAIVGAVSGETVLIPAVLLELSHCKPSK